MDEIYNLRKHYEYNLIQFEKLLNFKSCQKIYLSAIGLVLFKIALVSKDPNEIPYLYESYTRLAYLNSDSIKSIIDMSLLVSIRGPEDSISLLLLKDCLKKMFFIKQKIEELEEIV